MIKRYVWICCFWLALSHCSNGKHAVTPEHAYHQDGFYKGLTIQLLKVLRYSGTGLPEVYEDDSVRVDLIFDSGEVKKTLAFYKDNGNYYWKLNLKGRYKTIPINFENKKWYVLWSNEFGSKGGAFRTEFFLHKNSLGSWNIYPKRIGKL